VNGVDAVKSRNGCGHARWCKGRRLGRRKNK